MYYVVFYAYAQLPGSTEHEYSIIASFVIVQHILILRCMYLCQSRLGPGAYQVTHTQAPHACRVVTWFVPVRVSRGYMVCARVAWLHGLCPCACHVVTWFARVSHGYMVCAHVRVAWLHGLPIALILALVLPRVVGSASFNAVAFLVIIRNWNTCLHENM